MEHATFSNIEEQNIDFATSTMLYWFRKWEIEINFKLFSPSERNTVFCEILVDALLRGNVEARARAYANGRQWGYLSINDIRRRENMNTIGPEGDQYLDPLNMKPAGALPAAPPPDENKTVRETHRQLLAGQWQRVTTKVSRAIAKAPVKADFWERSREHARTVLSDAVIAYASTRNVTEKEARRALDCVLTTVISAGETIKSGDADRLAAETIKAINSMQE
jgi:hypothetical protein